MPDTENSLEVDKPHWKQFLMKFILFCVTLDVSDNLTETPNVKNSTGSFKANENQPIKSRQPRDHGLNLNGAFL